MISLVFPADAVFPRFARPSVPKKAPRPDLRLEIEQVGRAAFKNVRIRCFLVNRGSADILVDPSFLYGELLRVSFWDKRAKRRVHFKGEELLGYAPLNPQNPLSLGQGMFVGLTRDYAMNATPAGLTAQAIGTYKNFSDHPVAGLWEGK